MKTYEKMLNVIDSMLNRIERMEKRLGFTLDTSEIKKLDQYRKTERTMG